MFSSLQSPDDHVNVYFNSLSFVQLSAVLVVSLLSNIPATIPLVNSCGATLLDENKIRYL